MVSDIATATAEPSTETAPARTEAPPSTRRGRRRRRRGFSALTARILAVNIVGLGLLGIGLLYLGQYQESLVRSELGALKTQGQIFAAALGEGAVLDSYAGEGESLIPALGRQMMQRLVEPTHTRGRLFDVEGRLIADSRVLGGPGGDAVLMHVLPPPDNAGLVERLVTRAYDWVVQSLPGESYPAEVEPADPTAADYREVRAALGGGVDHAVRRERDSFTLVLSVAVPVQRYKQVLGAVLLSTDSAGIDQEVRGVRFEILKVFIIVLGVTVLLSLYLASTIARPIRRLAAAAERVRSGHGRQVTIPEFRHRRDEIGELARSFRAMTDALWARMDAIERFAADVAHEIKNPLTSLRSAVETAARVADPEKQKRLLSVVREDVSRMDRLITDISDASRLDAELSRVELEPVLIGRMLGTLVDMHQASADASVPRLILTLPGAVGAPEGDLPVLGVESRLVQVFRNLIANAISFSPPGAAIRVAAARQGQSVVVTVEDEGPGLPPGKLEAIFERFYSERPSGEKFGTHSGLGLSISKQIVDAHRGTIGAENRLDVDGSVMGARFTVRLPMGFDRLESVEEGADVTPAAEDVEIWEEVPLSQKWWFQALIMFVFYPAGLILMLFSPSYLKRQGKATRMTAGHKTRLILMFTLALVTAAYFQRYR